MRWLLEPTRKKHDLWRAEPVRRYRRLRQQSIAEYRDPGLHRGRLRTDDLRHARCFPAISKETSSEDDGRRRRPRKAAGFAPCIETTRCASPVNGMSARAYACGESGQSSTSIVTWLRPRRPPRRRLYVAGGFGWSETSEMTAARCPGPTCHR
jgi:hypothetical protein